jgi:hypothetical protein
MADTKTAKSRWTLENPEEAARGLRLHHTMQCRLTAQDWGAWQGNDLVFCTRTGT